MPNDQHTNLARTIWGNILFVYSYRCFPYLSSRNAESLQSVPHS